MAFAGGLGGEVELSDVPNSLHLEEISSAALLFAESNSRFLCEVEPDQAEAFQRRLHGVPHARIGRVTSGTALRVRGIAVDQPLVIDMEIGRLKQAWQAFLAAW